MLTLSGHRNAQLHKTADGVSGSSFSSISNAVGGNR